MKVRLLASMKRFLQLTRRGIGMFVRWKERRLKHVSYCALDVVVVCSQREDGKVRQTFVKHLGSIHKNHVEKMESRINFWSHAKRALDSLRLKPEMRSFLEQQLMARVAKPSEQEKRLYKEECRIKRARQLAKLNKKIVDRKREGA
jgi:hypothetical protein